MFDVKEWMHENGLDEKYICGTVKIATIIHDGIAEGLKKTDPLYSRLEKVVTGHPVIIFRDGAGYKILDSTSGNLRGKGEHIGQAVDAALEEFKE